MFAFEIDVSEESFLPPEVNARLPGSFAIKRASKPPTKLIFIPLPHFPSTSAFRWTRVATTSASKTLAMNGISPRDHRVNRNPSSLGWVIPPRLPQIIRLFLSHLREELQKYNKGQVYARGCFPHDASGVGVSTSRYWVGDVIKRSLWTQDFRFPGRSLDLVIQWGQYIIPVHGRKYRSWHTVL